MHQFQQATGDVQPQAGTLAQLSIAGQLRKRLEDGLKFVGRDPHPRINNVTAEGSPRPWS